MTRKTHRLAAAGLLAVALLPLVGCHEQVRANRAFDRRVGGMERTAAALIKNETQRPDKLAAVGPFLERELQKDADRFSRDLQAAKDYIRRDFRRFNDRLPLYGQKVGEAVRGKPENIERTAGDMFY